MALTATDPLGSGPTPCSITAKVPTSSTSIPKRTVQNWQQALGHAPLSTKAASRGDVQSLQWQLFPAATPRIIDSLALGRARITLHFVFTDKRALAAVRFRSFLRDCRRLERPTSEIECALDRERSALAAFIEEQHADVRRTYDPKVAPLVKRRKVMVMKGAFD